MAKSSKITDLLGRVDQVISLEVTPNVTADELKAVENPVFISITWHAKSYSNLDLAIPPILLATRLKEEGREVLLHLSCDLLTGNYLDKLLRYLRERDICNLFVILGDRFDPSQSDFQSTMELIVYIRAKTGDFFCIGVAGYPDDHLKMPALQAKVKSGANFIITQAIFEYHVYEKFLQVCENWDITVPIIPGIFLFETHEQLMSFAEICQVKITKSFASFVKSTKDGSEISGLRIMEKLMTDIILNRRLYGNMHIFTLDKLRYVYRVLEEFKFGK